MSPAVLARYRALAASPDRTQRQLGRAQLARLERATPPSAGVTTVSRWAHVPLVSLFAEAGNEVVARAGGRSETGHEPLHRSSSGRCVVIDPDRGVWWCRSCRKGGDAATLVMQGHGWSYRRACAWLTETFGQALLSAPPARGRPTRPAPRPPLSVEVR